MYKPSEEKKDYFCPRCKSQWTQLEVLDSVSPTGEGFLCHKCSGLLERDEVSAADRAGHERQKRLNTQVESIVGLLRQIDQQTIPQNDFQSALAHAVPIERDESINPTRQMAPVKPEPTSTVKGLKTEVTVPLEVSLNDGETLDSDRIAAERKAAQEAQNKLPDWYTKSTVTGETTALGKKEADRLASHGKFGASELKTEDGDSKESLDIRHAQLQAAYASFQEVQRLAELEPHSSEDDDDEDDDDDFEDVGIGGIGPSGINTPSSSISGAVNNNASFGSASNGVADTSSRVHIKPASESGSSGPGTSTVATPLPEYGGASPSKRVKLETGSAPAGNVTVDSDDDEEFEDAL